MSASKNNKMIRGSDSLTSYGPRVYYEVNQLVDQVYRLVKSGVGHNPIINSLSAK